MIGRLALAQPKRDTKRDIVQHDGTVRTCGAGAALRSKNVT